MGLITKLSETLVETQRRQQRTDAYKYFQNNPEGDFAIGSICLLPENLEHRLQQPKCYHQHK